MAIIQINHKGVEQTLGFLQQAGKKHIECVVLWLAKKQNGFLNIQTIYLPQQIADIDYFRIPQESLSELMAYLRHNRLMVAAQVHSHPDSAFHSKADDAWAIIRHVGGLSLVLPSFAGTTSAESFVKNTVVFRLSESNRWDEVSSNKVEQHYRVIP